MWEGVGKGVGVSPLRIPGVNPVESEDIGSVDVGRIEGRGVLQGYSIVLLFVVK